MRIVFPDSAEGFSKVDKREELGQETGWLQVTGAGALGRDKDFPCKMHSNRQRGNLIPGSGLIGRAGDTRRGPQMGLGWRHGGGEARDSRTRRDGSLAECFGRGQVSMEDSQADFIGCQALLHPSGLTIVF